MPDELAELDRFRYVFEKCFATFFELLLVLGRTPEITAVIPSKPAYE